MIYGITMGDSSGVGPEILLKAFRGGELEHPVVAFGDLAALEYYNGRLGWGVECRPMLLCRRVSRRVAQRHRPQAAGFRAK